MTLVTTRDLTREFTRRGTVFAAVDHVNLTVDAGEFIAIVGRSGNGKTTLLNLIAGLLAPTSGVVLIDNKAVSHLNDHELCILRARTLGFITQHHSLLPSLNILDNVLLPGEIAGEADLAGLEERGRELLERMDIAPLADAYPSELSGGELRRASVARAVINSPAIIIADEPTGDLDADSTALVLELLRDSAATGAAVIMVTHDQQALSATDTTYTIDNGVLSAGSEHS